MPTESFEEKARRMREELHSKKVEHNQAFTAFVSEGDTFFGGVAVVAARIQDFQVSAESLEGKGEYILEVVHLDGFTSMLKAEARVGKVTLGNVIVSPGDRFYLRFEGFGDTPAFARLVIPTYKLVY